MAICFDLQKDPAEVINMSDENFNKYIERSPKVIRNIKLNKSPIFQSYKFINRVSAHEGISEKIILNRNQFIKIILYLKNGLFLTMKKALEKENFTNQNDILAEESIYKKFTSYQDSKLMIDFHHSDWEKKNIIKTKFYDKRLTYFANLLIYEENPESLDQKTLKN